MTRQKTVAKSPGGRTHLRILHSASGQQAMPVWLDLANATLRRGTTALALKPKAFAVFRYLQEHPYRLITKQELFHAVWADTYVTDGVLKNCISEIRHVLQDSTTTPRYIETVSGRGYRCIATVTTQPVTSSQGEARGWRLETGEKESQKSKVKAQKSKVSDPQSSARSPQSLPSPQAPSLKPQVPREVEREAEGYFHKAIEIAQRQQAKSLELRAVMSLVRLRRQQALGQSAKSKEVSVGNTEQRARPTPHETRARLDVAHQMLSEVYHWFAEGFDTKDLQEAKALIEELSRWLIG